MRYGFSVVRLGLLALAAVTTLSTAAIADDYPEGCVDCHAQKQGAPVDFRLNILLRQIGHPRVDRLKTIPTACNRCHADEGGGEDDGTPKFSQLIHIIHFDVPQTNTYVQQFGGKCQHCHAIDVDAGEAVVKSGERNW